MGSKSVQLHTFMKKWGKWKRTERHQPLYSAIVFLTQNKINKNKNVDKCSCFPISRFNCSIRSFLIELSVAIMIYFWNHLTVILKNVTSKHSFLDCNCSLGPAPIKTRDRSEHQRACCGQTDCCSPSMWGHCSRHVNKLCGLKEKWEECLLYHDVPIFTFSVLLHEFQVD